MKKLTIFLGGMVTGGLVLATGEVVWLYNKTKKVAKNSAEVMDKINKATANMNDEDKDEVIKEILNKLSDESKDSILNVSKLIIEKIEESMKENEKNKKENQNSEEAK